jgi:type I restriction enzyme R subunit
MESERLTRKKRIDPQLESLGWRVVPFSEDCSLADLNNCAIEEFPTENGPAEFPAIGIQCLRNEAQPQKGVN